MSPHVIAAIVACITLVASGVTLWKGLGSTPASRKLPYELVCLVQLAMVAYAAVCAEIWSDGTVLSYLLSALGIIQAGLDPLLARGLTAAERADDAASYANAISEQLAAQQAHLKRSEQARQDLGKTRESLAKKFADVATALEAGNLELAKEALEVAEQSIPTRGDRICRNAALDALLQGKQKTCDGLGITLEARMGLGEDLPIPATEACAIIANLTDNAINACKPLAATGGHPIITLAARETGAHLVIKVENPYMEKAAGITQTRNEAAAAKTNSAQSAAHPKAPAKLDLADLPAHGWGTGIVQTLATRHLGSFETEAKYGHFTATVLIPITKQEIK